ncbi:MAG: YegS/Rv2252/BmrU family lipid kinase [Actinobacteria bacterium]|nr:YegS/Rv2252/BmrU family lipid kinase [Actinomycetota bacterium]
MSTDAQGSSAIMIVNPAAGRGRATHLAAEVLRAIRDRGGDLDVRSGSSAEATRGLVAEALAEHPDVLVIAGGDGTVTGVLDLLSTAQIPLVLVPAGTGNDFAGALDLPRDPDRIAETILSGVARSVDLGVVESARGTSLFLTVAAFGFDAKVAARTNRLRWPRGPLRYYLALLIELARLAPVRYRITDAAGTRELPGTLLAVCNTRRYGGGMAIAPEARPDDGRLDAVHVAPLGRITLLRLFPLLLRGAHLARAEVSTWSMRDPVRIDAPGMVVYADGELVAEGFCTVSVRPRALRVLVPLFRR